MFFLYFISYILEYIYIYIKVDLFIYCCINCASFLQSSLWAIPHMQALSHTLCCHSKPKHCVSRANICFWVVASLLRKSRMVSLLVRGRERPARSSSLPSALHSSGLFAYISRPFIYNEPRVVNYPRLMIGSGSFLGLGRKIRRGVG